MWPLPMLDNYAWVTCKPEIICWYMGVETRSTRQILDNLKNNHKIRMVAGVAEVIDRTVILRSRGLTAEEASKADE
jgi:hypothetical protein